MKPIYPTLSWDIFCNVIDNYGDIGVAWRLARQLRHEFQQAIRLWVDDLQSFSRLCPDLDPQAISQHIEGIAVLHWQPRHTSLQPLGDVVLDAFGCQLPDAFIAAMAHSLTPPIWINLEYLSAEDWIECCHGMCSPHPRYAIQRHFFFPGFGAQSGGIIAERDTMQLAQNWADNPLLRQAYLASLGLPVLPAGARVVSLFSYHNPAIAELLQTWAEGDTPIVCLVPEGKILQDINQRFLTHPLAVGQQVPCGALSLYAIPFSDQQEYDRLLWSCDINFVRGEDSFVRAQLAGKPLVWHSYPQDDAAHWVKLDAFCNRYLQGTAPQLRQAMQGLNHAWNHGEAIGPAWMSFEAMLPQLETHARQWRQSLLTHDDLATRLLKFVDERRAPTGK